MIILIINLISSLLQVLGQGECFQSLFPKVIAHSELNEHFVALNNSGKPEKVWLTLGKRLDEFFLKQRRFNRAGQYSTLYILKGIL